MCSIVDNRLRACQEPGCKAVYKRQHNWSNYNYCPEHTLGELQLDRPGQCIIRPTRHYARPVTSGAGFMERFME